MRRFSHDQLKTTELNWQPPLANSGPVEMEMEMETPQNLLIQTDWANLNVPGSPWLSRLLGALEIECLNTVPLLSLEGENPEEAQYLTQTQLQDLWNGENKSIICDSKTSTPNFQSRLNISRAPRKTQTGRVFLQEPASASHRRNPSPFDETFIFPPQPTATPNKYRDLDQPLWMALRSRAAELEERLPKLKPLLGIAHPNVLAMTTELARTYLEQGDIRKSGNLLRHVAHTTQNVYGPSHVKTLDAWLDVADYLKEYGKQSPALKLINKLQPEIFKLGQPANDVATKSMDLRSDIAAYMRDWDLAEEIIRPLLQVRLEQSGPSCQDTWDCMINMGNVLAQKGDVSEAERLLRFTLQLIGIPSCLTVKYLSRAFNHLANTCCLQRRYEEGQFICRKAITTLEASLGQNSPHLLTLYGRGAWMSLRQRRLNESEMLFRRVIKQSYDVRGQLPLVALIYTEGLATNLELLGRIDEAASLYENVYYGFSEIFPLESARVLMTCYALGQFYQTQGRRDESLKLYKDHIGKMEKLQETGEPLTPDVQVAIARVHQWMTVAEPAPFGIRDLYLLDSGGGL
jgi:tetratricopeptide (TPR) repeat protein